MRNAILFIAVSVLTPVVAGAQAYDPYLPIAPVVYESYWPYVPYSSYEDPVHRGEHPYDIRYREITARKRVKKISDKIRRHIPYTSIFDHPATAERRELHPFYRRDGRSFFNDGSNDFANWRGYLPPYSLRSMSPDTHCANFGGERPFNRFAPFGYECF